MMSLETIADLSRAVAVRAQAYELEPYQPANSLEPLKWKLPFPVPNLGQYRPAGWTLVEHTMVDATGEGYSWEPAKTWDQFRQWCSQKAAFDPTAGFGIIEEGQFQVMVGYFTQDAEATGSDPIEWDECPYCEQPVEIGEKYCPFCESEIDPDPEDDVPFQEEDIVTFFYKGKKITGIVVIVNELDEQCTVEWEDETGTNLLDVYWTDLENAYNPADDPNQIALPWDYLGAGI